MSIKLRPSVSRLLDTDTRSKRFQTFEIRPFAIPRLKRCLLRTTVTTAVEQECGMYKRRGPVYSRDAGTIQEGSSDLCEGANKPFYAAILDCCIWAGWFNDVVMVRQLLAKGMGTCNFSTKVSTKHTTFLNSVFLQEQIYQVEGRMFRTAWKNLSVPCEVIDYGQVQ